MTQHFGQWFKRSLEAQLTFLRTRLASMQAGVS